MLSSSATASSNPSPPHPVSSDPRPVTMETYWREVETIKEEKEGEEEEEEEERKSMDEVELDEVWLTEAGLSSLVMGSSSTEDAPPPAEAVLSTLTRQQAATVRKRLDNYNETLKKRNRQPVRDVRNIFTEPDDDSAFQCPSPPPHPAESPPSRYHTTTKTIRRNANRVRPTMFVFEDQQPEQPSPPALIPSPPHTLLAPVSRLRPADWLLRDSPYSEVVAEHKQGGACRDCFHQDEISELQFAPVSPSQGLTCTDDLSSRDLTRLSFISHIELSTFLLALGIQTKRTRPPRSKTRGALHFYTIQRQV